MGKEWGVPTNGLGVSFQSDKTVLKPDSSDDCPL